MMMNNYPITSKYKDRGCVVNINASTQYDVVFIDVQNKEDKSKHGHEDYYLHDPGSFCGYSNEDKLNIKKIINKLLEENGDDNKCNTHYINQILS